MATADAEAGTTQGNSSLSEPSAVRRLLSSKNVLIVVTVLALVFFDFETLSLDGYMREGGTGFDEQHTRDGLPVDGLLQMQQQQLQTQLADYWSRAEGEELDNAQATTNPNDGSPAGVEEIVIEDVGVSSQDDDTNKNETGMTDTTSQLVADEKNITGDDSTVASVNRNTTQRHFCDTIHSKKWLDGPRHSNADNAWTEQQGIDYIRTSHDSHWIVDAVADVAYNTSNVWQRIGSDTLCSSISTFRNPTIDDTKRSSRDRLVQEWAFRLMYWALQAHHTEPALEEAEARAQCQDHISEDNRDGSDSDQPTSTDEKAKQALSTSEETVSLQPSPPRPLPSFDYECKDAKYLVTSMRTIGMGVSLRLGAVNAMLMGYATGRITVFVNNVKNGNFVKEANFLSDPWSLASCDRSDMQCIFLPTTPCVLTIEDLRNGTVLDEGHARGLRRQGILSEQFDSHRVLISESRLNAPMRWNLQGGIKKRLSQKLNGLLDSMNNQISAEAMSLLKNAVRKIRLDGGIRRFPKQDASLSEQYDYGFRFTQVAHAALLYMMRPNPATQASTDARLRAVLPPDFDPSRAVGFPIRGSDKCNSESICIGFAKHMRLANETYYQTPELSSSLSASPPYLILTTEDKGILEARYNYTNGSNNNNNNNNNNTGADFPSMPSSSFPYNFVVNEQDVMQGTGAPQFFLERGDRILIDSLVALKMQMQSRYLFGNCCSNFALVLMDMMHEGCGAVPDPTVKCMQELPKYNICCSWTQTEKCDRLRRGEPEEEETDETIQNKTDVSVGNWTNTTIPPGTSPDTILTVGAAIANATQAFIKAERKEIKRLRLSEEAKQGNNANATNSTESVP